MNPLFQDQQKSPQNSALNGEIVNSTLGGNNTPYRAPQSPNQALMEVVKMCKGRDPKDVFYEECKKRNIDPEIILKQLR